jgi:hypothetical protein
MFESVWVPTFVSTPHSFENPTGNAGSQTELFVNTNNRLAQPHNSFCGFAQLSRFAKPYRIMIWKLQDSEHPCCTNTGKQNEHKAKLP